MKKITRTLVAIFLVIGVLAGLCTLLVSGYRQYRWKVYPLHYRETIENYSEQYGVTPSLICGVIHTESHFQADAQSHAGAFGLMQLTSETFHWAQMRDGVKDPKGENALLDPETNIQYGVFTLRLLHEMFLDPTAALAAYNAGQGNVKKWLEDPRYSEDGVHLLKIPFAETEAYVKRVKKAQTIYRELYQLD
jgi:soluble lytic murein transglycosylase